MNQEPVASSEVFRVALADNRAMESQLLAGALRNGGFEVFSCEACSQPILDLLRQEAIDVLIVSCTGMPGENSEFSVLRAVRRSCPELPKVALLDENSQIMVVQAFRSGARGIFCLADSSFSDLCNCLRQVRRGEIWASERQLGFLIDCISQPPATHLLNAAGEKLLTSREEQVAALVADGLSNRDIAAELRLSEHTVKKYLFRIFEKLGISNRVELVLYTAHHGGRAEGEEDQEGIASASRPI